MDGQTLNVRDDCGVAVAIEQPLNAVRSIARPRRTACICARENANIWVPVDDVAVIGIHFKYSGLVAAQPIIVCGGMSHEDALILGRASNGERPGLRHAYII